MSVARVRWVRWVCGVLTATVAVALVGVPGESAAADPFYSYSGSRALGSYAPGAVLKTRTVSYHLLNVPSPITTTQILYRSTDSLGAPTTGVTSVLRPPGATGPARMISYQSYYDSLNPEDSPSRAIAGDLQFGGLTPRAKNIAGGGLVAGSETTNLVPLLLAGYTVNIPDTEGPNANFAAGPQYGKLTLDSLRAARGVRATGVTDTTKVGLLGYSGGAIASNWAAIEAPAYAPDVNRNLVGVAEGGVLANPAHNLSYAAGSVGWAGIVGMAVVGIARSFKIDFSRYLNDFGRRTIARLQDASILNAYFQYPGLTWQKLTKPQYANPNSVPEFVEVVNKINMGTAPVPTVPFFIGQAANGVLEGTNPGPAGIGRGDGIMVAGDVRALANRYCGAGLRVQYDQYDAVSHIPGALLWYPGAVAWMFDRFAGKSAPSSCGRIPAGNSLAPQQFAG